MMHIFDKLTPQALHPIRLKNRLLTANSRGNMKSANTFCRSSHLTSMSQLPRWGASAGWALALGGALLFSPVAAFDAHADVPISGSFVATQACPAFQSFRKSTNPGDIQTAPNKAYEVIAKNKPDASHYRIIVNGADPEERWVSVSCGHIDAKGQAQEAPQSPTTPSTTAAPDASTAKRATHVLALSWEPTFCEQHRDKSECREFSTSSFGATHFRLHGLWPQPRGTQYCKVPAEIRDTDDNHDWNSLPEPELSADNRKRLGDVMPGLQ